MCPSEGCDSDAFALRVEVYIGARGILICIMEQNSKWLVRRYNNVNADVTGLNCIIVGALLEHEMLDIKL